MGTSAAQELFAELPSHPVSPISRINLYELVPLLLNEYRDWGEEDLVEFVEERTRQRIHPEDLTTLRAVYQRCLTKVLKPGKQAVN
jgi:ribosomal protein S18